MTLDQLKDAIRTSAQENGLDETLDALADLYHELGEGSDEGVVLFALSVANKLLGKVH